MHWERITQKEKENLTGFQECQGKNEAAWTISRERGREKEGEKAKEEGHCERSRTQIKPRK